MSWSFDEFVSKFSESFSGEIIAEYGDIRGDVANPGQCQVSLFHTVRGSTARLDLRASEAWDFAQQWANRSGRPVRLRLSGELQEDESFLSGTWGVKTFQPRIQGESGKEIPLPAMSAFSDVSPRGFATTSSEHGTWRVPYGWDEEKVAIERLPGATVRKTYIFSATALNKNTGRHDVVTALVEMNAEADGPNPEWSQLELWSNSIREMFDHHFLPFRCDSTEVRIGGTTFVDIRWRNGLSFYHQR
jgi:hypothetical protein